MALNIRYEYKQAMKCGCNLCRLTRAFLARAWYFTALFRPQRKISSINKIRLENLQCICSALHRLNPAEDVAHVYFH